MNVIEELRSLDTSDPGRWPLPFRIAAVALVLVAVSALGIWQMVIKVEIPELEAAERQEQELRASFEQKQRRAANFDAYRNQLAEIERDFGTMLRQLPGQTEVDSLLEDISQTALASGLEEKLFQPRAEAPQDFYAELPIRLRYTGSYHELAEFVSGVAALPRIVTLHDIRVTPVEINGDEELQLDVTGKTYRYLDEESP
jgi:type IV pilus assembly protein PilO